METTVGFFPVPGMATVPPCFPAHTGSLCTLTLPPTGREPADGSPLPEQQGAAGPGAAQLGNNRWE